MRHDTFRNGILIERRDDTTRTVTRWDDKGALIPATPERPNPAPYTPAEVAAATARAAALTVSANEKALRDKATAALGANTAFLAVAAPTQAQTLAQVKALTRQVNALIRLEVDALSDTAST